MTQFAHYHPRSSTTSTPINNECLSYNNNSTNNNNNKISQQQQHVLWQYLTYCGILIEMRNMVESMHHSSEQYLSDVVMIQGSPGIVDDMDMFDFEDESCCCNVSFDDDDEVLSSSNNSTHSATTNHLLAGTVKAEEKMSGIGGNSFSPTTSASVIQKQLLSIYNSKIGRAHV